MTTTSILETRREERESESEREITGANTYGMEYFTESKILDDATSFVANPLIPRFVPVSFRSNEILDPSLEDASNYDTPPSFPRENAALSDRERKIL